MSKRDPHKIYLSFVREGDTFSIQDQDGRKLAGLRSGQLHFGDNNVAEIHLRVLDAARVSSDTLAHTGRSTVCEVEGCAKATCIGSNRCHLHPVAADEPLIRVMDHAEVETNWPEDEQRIDAIGQNGNGGEHYSPLSRTWHKHDGKWHDAELNEGTLVEIVHRDGSHSGPCGALPKGGYWIWAGQPHQPKDIVAFRLL